MAISCSTKEFFIDRYHYTIIDVPGHRDFVKNMISGARQADVALLMVSESLGGFGKAISKGNRSTGEVEGQTRQCAPLANFLGVEMVISRLKKMDNTPQPLHPGPFQRVCRRVLHYVEVGRLQGCHL